jgi:SPP1 gp7 family putative phage head morphogenesis protein
MARAIQIPARRMAQRFVAQLGPLLAIAMTVADLSGRARVLADVEAELGRRTRPRIGLSFAEGELLTVEKLEPAEALMFYRQKMGMTRAAFDRLQQRYRHLAFTVANVESVSLVEQVQGALDDALATGKTRDAFVEEANRILRSAGVSELSPFHLETVFATNANAAYQTGRAYQMRQADVLLALPFWRYATVGDSRVRPAHRAMHGFVARADDPIWTRWYPPNGFRCRCSVFAISRAEAERRASASGQDLSVAGSRRAKVEPDEGFATAPWAALKQRLEEARN